MPKAHKYTASFVDIAPHKDFIAFIREYSPNFKMEISKRDPKFIAELHHLNA